MKWDVFISYASEDKFLARLIALGLQHAGLDVWFDEFALEAGDSLRRSIDKGLRDSRHGVVVLSQEFFRKEWPQRELDGLTARDDGTTKVIIPVWYGISAEEVRKYSPLLADKLAVPFEGSAERVITKLLRAIHKDRLSQIGWQPEFVMSSRGLSLVVLPVHPFEDLALCIGRYPITNGEYQSFVRDSGHRPPVGQRYVAGGWSGPFQPWVDPAFRDMDKPVVCCDFLDAVAFCKWATSDEVSVFLPVAGVWDYSASAGQWRGERIHHTRLEPFDKARTQSAPSAIDRNAGRENALGISDIGNVWEWCNSDRHPVEVSLVSRDFRIEAELRGGGFLDDLTTIAPSLRSGMLEDGTRTRHFDLGFRVCATVPLDRLNNRVADLLHVLPTQPDYWFFSSEKHSDYRYIGRDTYKTALEAGCSFASVRTGHEIKWRDRLQITKGQWGLEVHTFGPEVDVSVIFRADDGCVFINPMRILLSKAETFDKARIEELTSDIAVRMNLSTMRTLKEDPAS